MRVVSQKGSVSVEMDNADIYIRIIEKDKKNEKDEFQIRATTTTQNDWCLGVYETLDRAQEVFSDIHVRYADVMRNQLVLDAESDLMVKYCSEGTLDKYLEMTKWSYLFQLPKK